MEPLKPFQIKFIHKILLLAVLILIGLVYLVEQKIAHTADKDYTKQLIPDTSKISNEISVDLEKKILGDDIEEEPVDLSPSTNNAMMIKLSAMIKASGDKTTPSDEELSLFYRENKRSYGGKVALKFPFYFFSSIQLGGQALEKSRAALASLNSGLSTLKSDSFSESGVFDGEYGWSDERDSEIYKTFGSGFGKKIAIIIEDREQEALPCWEGPISGRLGYYIICIEEAKITDPPPLDQVREEVINDWRLSNISNP